MMENYQLSIIHSLLSIIKMPFNVQTFKTRATTALVFVAVMLGGLLTNVWSFLALFVIINIGCLFEYFKLMGKIDTRYADISLTHKLLVTISSLGLISFMCFQFFPVENQFTFKNIGWWLLCFFGIVFPIKEFVLAKHKSVKNLAYSFFGLIYISLSLALLINIRTNYISPDFLIYGETTLGFVIPLILIASIWINDTMAYLVGSFIGKTPFSSISPKKTWEGTIGGAILCILVVGVLIAPWLAEDKNKSLLQNVSVHWFGIAALAAIFGTLGDLFESKLKRLANVKDSGSFMPGHGGFLDRFDSLLVATPFVWLYVYLFM